MFDADLISSIFGNIEDILQFQEIFLEDLSETIDSEVFPANLLQTFS